MLLTITDYTVADHNKTSEISVTNSPPAQVNNLIVARRKNYVMIRLRSADDAGSVHFYHKRCTKKRKLTSVLFSNGSAVNHHIVVNDIFNNWVSCPANETLV